MLDSSHVRIVRLTRLRVESTRALKVVVATGRMMHTRRRSIDMKRNYGFYVLHLAVEVRCLTLSFDMVLRKSARLEGHLMRTVRENTR